MIFFPNINVILYIYILTKVLDSTWEREYKKNYNYIYPIIVLGNACWGYIPQPAILIKKNIFLSKRGKTSPANQASIVIGYRYKP
jgi:hypothetical protein